MTPVMAPRRLTSISGVGDDMVPGILQLRGYRRRELWLPQNCPVLWWGCLIYGSRVARGRCVGAARHPLQDVEAFGRSGRWGAHTLASSCSIITIFGGRVLVW